MHLEAGHLLAVDRDDLALEADVRDLDAGAGVRAAVDGQGDAPLQVGVGQARVELGRDARRQLLGLHDRELAELQPGAGQGRAGEGARIGIEPQLAQAGDGVVDLLGGHVQEQQVLQRGGAHPVGADPLGQVRQAQQDVPAQPADGRLGPHPEAAVLLLVDADVVGVPARLLRCRAVRQGAPQVVVLEDLSELLRPPLGHEELQPGLVAQATVAVVAEDADDAVPDVQGVLRRDEGPQPLTQTRGGGQGAGHPQVVAGTELGVVDAHEGDVVDLVEDVEAGGAGDGRLELAGQIGQLGVTQVGVLDGTGQRGRIDDLVLGDAGHRGDQEPPRRVPAALDRGQPHRLQAPPQLWDIVDLHPVQLDVLPVGDVGGAAGEVVGDRAEHPQLLAAQAPTVQAHPLHEVAVGELGGVQLGGAAAVDPLLALGVQTPPAETAGEVIGCDALVAAGTIDAHDPVAHRQRVPVLLEGLVVIERLAPVEGPLAVGAGLARWAQGAGGWRDGGGHCSSMTVACHWRMRSVRGRPGVLLRVEPAGPFGWRQPSQRGLPDASLRRIPRCGGEVPVVSGAGQARQHMTAWARRRSAG